MKLLSFVFSIFHSLPRRNKFVPHQSSLRDESSLYNRSYHHEPCNKTLVDFNNVTGKWLFTNTHTNTIFIINIYDNFTWSSNVHMNYVYLGGIWNMYNSDDDIDLTTSVRTSGDYIWLLAQKRSKHQNRFYLNSDILYIGKITNLAKQYYYSEEMPSDTTTQEQIIASKINGTIIYGCELEPERNETFVMTRWWEHH